MASKSSRYDDRKQMAPSTWHLETDRTRAAKGLVQWSDESIVANWPIASRAYLYASAYEGYMLTSLNSFGADVACDLTLGDRDVPVYVNRIRAIGKAFVAKTGANDDPVPQFVTNAGDFAQRQAAEDMDGVVCAEYSSQQGAYADFHGLCRKLELMVTTALGRGWIFVFPGCYAGKWKPEAEIDDGLSIGLVREHQYGRIIRLTRSTWRDPEHLMGRYKTKKHREAILKNVELVQPEIKSGRALNATAGAELRPTQRLVRVVQGWSIGSGPDDPGREMFTLKDGHWLEDNVWERQGPPGRHIDYEEDLGAGGGTPLTHAIYRLFCREQEMIHDANELERNSSMKTLLVPMGSTIKKQLESSTGINVIEVEGDLNTQIRELEDKPLPRKTVELLTMYAGLQHEIPGVSRAHADATQPNHVSSGVQASLEASLFPELHADFVLRFNRFRAVDCAELFVWAIQDIVASGDAYETWAGDDEVRRLIKGDKLDMDQSKYKIQVKPASERKDSLSARQAKAERWLEDPTVTFTGADMAQFWKTNDVDHYSDELGAITAGVQRQMRQWRSLPLETARARYRSPAKYMTLNGLESALRVVVADYEDARDGKVPEDRLKLWEQYMDQCVALIRALKLDEAQLMAEAQLAAQGAANGQVAAAGTGAAAGGAAPGVAP